MSELGRYSVPRLYYLVTPAFIALDHFAGVNVRGQPPERPARPGER